MKNYLKKRSYLIIYITLAMLIYSCKKDNPAKSQDNVTTNTGNPTGNAISDTATLRGTAQTSSAFPNFGFAVLYGTMSTNAAYVATVKKEATM